MPSVFLVGFPETSGGPQWKQDAGLMGLWPDATGL